MNIPVRLTEYSHGAGCGCKIAPSVLDAILKSEVPALPHPNLLIGNESRDDAAVYDLGNQTALISTTDFFMPIVDDPFEFGRIAAANAISDVYAMGGKPILAIAILGWPVNKLSPEIASAVVAGGRSLCAEAGIPLAGGHSIDAPEPIFGLAVSGVAPLANIKANNTGRPGDLLLLTKPIGIGVLTTAGKKGLLRPEHEALAPSLMTRLNRVGEDLGRIPGVHAMTDVTGFGLLGHLTEMAEGSGLGAEISFSKVPLLTDDLPSYIARGCAPGGTRRNWDSYGSKISPVPESQWQILADPQTSGGLLIAVSPRSLKEVQAALRQADLAEYTDPIGSLVPYAGVRVTVNP